jgi:hypothetical protein
MFSGASKKTYVMHSGGARTQPLRAVNTREHVLVRDSFVRDAMSAPCVCVCVPRSTPLQPPSDSASVTSSVDTASAVPCLMLVTEAASPLDDGPLPPLPREIRMYKVRVCVLITVVCHNTRACALARDAHTPLHMR